MVNPPFPNPTSGQQPSSAWGEALVLALGREEAAGRQVPRLTEAGVPTWNRFRGRLKGRDFLGLLFEDASVLHAIPFDPTKLSALTGVDISLSQIPEDLADQWLHRLQDLDMSVEGPNYILEQARLLGVPMRMARADLHVVKPHHKVLELPGTGGQLAHHLVSTHPGLSLQENFVLACETWKELTLAGIVALDLRSPTSEFIVRAEPSDLKLPEHPLRQQSFDFVIGLHPDKGGMFRVENQLAIWFPSATILLV